MKQTTITVVGNLATPVDRRDLGGGRAVANFRIACTESRLDRATGTWHDGDTLFIGVACWRELADNVAATLGRGDPVIVRGRIYTSDYTDKEGRRQSVTEIEADAVGPDLARSRATGLVRTRRGSGEAPADGGLPGAGTPAEPSGPRAPAVERHEALPAGGC